MRKKWKIGILALLCTIGVVGTMKMTADASAITEDDVIVDYVYETMTVNTDEDTLIYYTDTYYPELSRWNVCEVRDADNDGDKEAVFDISWVDEEKTVRIYLRGDVKQEVVGINLTWQEEFGVKFVGTLLETDITEAQVWKEIYEDYPKFSEDTGYFIFTIEENKRDNYYFDLDTIEWRKGSDGAWRAFEELDLKEMNIRGIKLEFRIKANNEFVATDNGVSATSMLTDSGTRPSSIAKVSISRLGDRPEIGVNSDIMTVDLRNGVEFSLDKETWTLIPTYSKKLGSPSYLIDYATREKAISPIYTNKRITSLLAPEILGFPVNTEMTESNLSSLGSFEYKMEDGVAVGVIIYVREAGTSKKAASLIKEVVIPFAEENMSLAKREDFDIYYADSRTGTGGIVCENISNQNTLYPDGLGVKYQVAILSPKEYKEYEDSNQLDNIDVSTLKWMTVKPGRMLKLANKKVEEGSYLVYRITGENGKLPSTYLISEEIRYDRITYVDFYSSSKKEVGELLEVVISTNVRSEVEYKWERYKPLEGEEIEDNAIIKWETIPNIVTNTYELQDADEGCYIRVTVTAKDDASNTKTSDIIGPIRERSK